MSTDPVSPDANAARAAPAPFIRSRAGPDSEPPGDAVEQRIAGCDGREYERHAFGQRRFDLLDRARPFGFAQRCVDGHELGERDDPRQQDRHGL